MKSKVLVLAFILVAQLFVCGADLGDKLTRQQYVDLWKKTAVNNMKQYGIPASIILAQGILESGCGNSVLATEANNHFGIKCHEWTGEKHYHDDDAKQECFRKYNNAAESYADHAIFLKNRKRYASLFELDVKDYKGWAYGLKKAGYATNPKYPELIIKIIEDAGLQVFDDGVIPNEPKEAPPLVQKTKKQKRKAAKKDSEEEITIYLDRQIFKHPNNIKFIKAEAGDTPQKIADALQLGLWQICKYNDIDKNVKLSEGEMVFIQPKRRKGKEENCTVKKGETLLSISRTYGVKLKRLYKLNQLSDTSSNLVAGAVIKLR